MKAPYYRVTAVCRNERCGTVLFERDRKKVDRVSTGGQAYRTRSLVCPECGQWADVVKIEEIAD